MTTRSLPAPHRQQTGHLFDLLARRLVLDRLDAITEGRLMLLDGEESRSFGRATENGLDARITVREPAFYTALASGGSLGAAEAYVDGLWEADDLTAVIRIMARNREAALGLEGGLARLGRSMARLYHARRKNTRRGSRRNILEHYDLGNELFERFLDPSMTYSGALFLDPEATLEEAQRAKLDRLCRKLDLGPEDRVLEIGTGWGSFALHAARTYGCRVTTTTLSSSQRQETRRRVTAAGLEERIEVLDRDYRDLEGVYDKIASIEMIEAVGHEYLPAFFEVCHRHLAPGGLLGLQAITIADRNYEAARRSVDFIQRYVFPGGALPSVTALTRAATEASDLSLLHLEELGLHYAETLRRWRIRFEEEWPKIAEHGFDDRFRRLWRYYLAYCEGGFLERVIGAAQMIFAGPEFRDETLKGLIR